jgi:glutathione synthase/RimK-type ligase-like ATP-grasp enzyme
MADKHWQIMNWSSKNENSRVGNVESIAPESAPSGLLRTALKATALIGKGLYGVDMKEQDSKFFVIEINDNPSIDAGIEDKVPKEKLYRTIMESFINKIKSVK